MIAALLLAAAVPPAPSGATLPPGAVEILNPIADAVARYDGCIKDRFDEKNPRGVGGNPDLHRREMVKAIAACAEVRRSAVAEAETALAETPDYRDPARRGLAIRHAFEGTEEMRREFLALALGGKLPSTAPPMPEPVRVPEGTMPAVMEYMNCVVHGTNALARERLPTRESRQERAVALDATCRDRAIKSVPKVTNGRIAKLNETGIALLEAAMDRLGADTIEAFVDPAAMMRRRGYPVASDVKPDAEN